MAVKWVSDVRVLLSGAAVAYSRVTVAVVWVIHLYNVSDLSKLSPQDTCTI